MIYVVFCQQCLRTWRETLAREHTGGLIGAVIELGYGVDHPLFCYRTNMRLAIYHSRYGLD